jgi:hypothetical protein
MKNSDLYALAKQVYEELLRLGFDIDFDDEFVSDNYTSFFSKSKIWINNQTSEAGLFLSFEKESSLFRLWNEREMKHVLLNLKNCSSQKDVSELIRKTGTLSYPQYSPLK